jgi:hypothetical protein
VQHFLTASSGIKEISIYGPEVLKKVITVGLSVTVCVYACGISDGGNGGGN